LATIYISESRDAITRGIKIWILNASTSEIFLIIHGESRENEIKIFSSFITADIW